MYRCGCPLMCLVTLRNTSQTTHWVALILEAPFLNYLAKSWNHKYPFDMCVFTMFSPNYVFVCFSLVGMRLVREEQMYACVACVSDGNTEHAIGMAGNVFTLMPCVFLPCSCERKMFQLTIYKLRFAYLCTH